MTSLDFRLNRVFSTPLARLLLKTPLTPNQVTCLSLASGMAAGFFFSKGRYETSLIAAGFYILACLLDNCDGEIARTKKLSSVFGGWFDIVADFFADTAVFTGIAISMLGRGDDTNVLLFLFLCLSGATIHCGLVVLEKLRGFGPAVYGNPNARTAGSVRFFKLFDALREGDACWLVLVFALAGESHTLLWFGGVYMQVLWTTALYLNRKQFFR